MLAEIRKTRAKTLVAMKAGSPLPRSRTGGGGGGSGSGTRSPFTVAICKVRKTESCGDFTDTFYLDVNSGTWFGNGGGTHPSGNFIGEDDFPARDGEDVFLMCGGRLEIGSLTRDDYKCTEDAGGVVSVCGKYVKPCSKPWTFYMYDTGTCAVITNPRIYYINRDGKEVKDILSGGALKGTILSIISVNKVLTQRSTNYSPKGYEISRVEVKVGEKANNASTEVLRSDFWYGGGDGSGGEDDDNYPLGWRELSPNVWSYSGSVGIISNALANSAGFGSSAIKVKLFQGGEGTYFCSIEFGWENSCYDDGYFVCNGYTQSSKLGGLFGKSEICHYGGQGSATGEGGFGICAFNYVAIRDCGGVFDFSNIFGSSGGGGGCGGEPSASNSDCGGCGSEDEGNGKIGVLLRKLETKSTEITGEPEFKSELYYLPVKKKFYMLGGNSQPVVLMRSSVSTIDCAGEMYCKQMIYRHGDNIFFDDPSMYEENGKFIGGRRYSLYVPVGIVRKVKKVITKIICSCNPEIKCYVQCRVDAADVSTFTHGIISPSLAFVAANNREKNPKCVVESCFRNSFIDIKEPSSVSSLRKEVPDGNGKKEEQKSTAECAIRKLGGAELPKRSSGGSGGSGGGSAQPSVASLSAARVLTSPFAEDAAEVIEAQDL